MQTLEIETPHGIARAHVHSPAGMPMGTLVLGHGAGGGPDAADLVAAREAALAAGWTAVLTEQPYRVAGRRAPAPAAQLDVAFAAIVAALRPGIDGVPLVTGGRSSGARVACRTVPATGAVGVLALAFPLLPPGATDPAKSRQGELDGASVPALVLQGDKDPFGRPAPDAALDREVVLLPGTHTLKAAMPTLRDAVAAFLARFTPDSAT